MRVLVRRDWDNSVLWCQTSGVRVSDVINVQRIWQRASFVWTRSNLHRNVFITNKANGIIIFTMFSGIRIMLLRLMSQIVYLTYSLSSSVDRGPRLWSTTVSSWFRLANSRIRRIVEIWLPPKVSPMKGKQIFILRNRYRWGQNSHIFLEKIGCFVRAWVTCLKSEMYSRVD